jgi:flagellar hook-associated protein 2
VPRAAAAESVPVKQQVAAAKPFRDAAVTEGMTNAITALNAGSGIDVRALTTSLVDAERAPRVKLLDDRQARVDARISAMAQFRSGLDGVVGALDGRIRSGALSGIPAISDASVLGISVTPGSIVPRQQIEVRALARPQTLASAPVADQAAPVGLGALTFRFGAVAGDTAPTGFAAGTVPDLVVTIGADRNSLTGLRDAINDAAAAAGAPVEARILTDASGSRLQLRGATGEASGFTVAAAGDAGLQAFAFAQGVTGGLERTQAAADARVALDGLELRRPTNRITDLVPGATLTLTKAAPGQPVTIEAQRSGAELAQAVRDLAQTLNELVGFGRQLASGGTTGGSPGALASDGTTRRVLQQLGSLTSRQVVPPNGSQPTRLSELGLSVDRTGAFVLDETKLARATSEQPAAIEAMLTALNAQATADKPAGPLRQMAEQVRSVSQGSAGQPTALQRESAAIARDRAQMEARIERLRESYTRQFTRLDLAVGQSRQLQTYLKQQIDLWTNAGNQ